MICLFISGLFCLPSKAQQPGENVSSQTIRKLGEKHFFSISTIPDDIFRLMQGKTYKKNCTVARSELRYIRCLHVDKDGRNIVGEMVVNKAIATDVLDILKKLYEAKYPIERMRLIDYWDADDERAMRANNSSSFNFRFISHTHTVSKHGRGLAVDINTLYNPYHKRLKNGKEVVEPATARPYLDRSKNHAYMIKKAISATGSSRQKDSDGEVTGNTAKITSTSKNRNAGKEQPARKGHKKTMPMLHHFFSNYGIAFYYPNDLFYM